MPQGPIAIANINVAAQGAKNSLNITAATLVKATRGTLLGVQIIVAGSAPGTINDVATLAGVADANVVAAIPNDIGPAPIASCGIPCLNGIVVTPGAGQTLAVFYI